MVQYDSKEYFRNLINFYRSYTLRRILMFVIIMGLISAGFVTAKKMLFPDWTLDFHIVIFSLLGIILSLLLVFRTNSAYDRWWEGRKQWGALVNHCRNLSIFLQGMLPVDDEKNRAFFAKHISNYCISLKEHLRKGTKLEELIHMSPEEVAEYKTKVHVPNFIASKIFGRIQNLYKSEVITGDDILNIKPQVQALTDILGACERIKKTPIPFSYNVYIKTILLVYCAALPIGLVQYCGWMTIPLVMFIFFAMMSVEMLAEEIEDPFGLDCNDLPTGTLAHTIKNNVYEIFSFPQEVEQPQEIHDYEKIF